MSATEHCDEIDYSGLHSLTELPPSSLDAVVISTTAVPGEKNASSAPHSFGLTPESIDLLDKSIQALRLGGHLFIYGIPKQLPFWGEYLSAQRAEGVMLFRYWIALDIDDAPRGAFLKPTHRGLLMYFKSQPDGKTRPVALNTNAVRIRHGYCIACGENLKDWGGKKHLMNPSGVAISDVWRDLPRRPISTSTIPEDVLVRIKALTDAGPNNFLHVVQKTAAIQNIEAPRYTIEASDGNFTNLTQAEIDRVYLGDSINFLRQIKRLHPDGLFDLVFADPPYNLAKGYDEYKDNVSDETYVRWCNNWLLAMADSLKPGGSLMVLNLPKWAVRHAAFLNGILEFRHWIAWDALSDPRGKLMPAHYALLYYTKPAASQVFNYSPIGAPLASDFVEPPDSPKYCLRARCVRHRKRTGNDEKVELSDVWFDVHRIKHKRDRDAHPCQLPDKLMERIVSLTTSTGDIVFDPFCGAGTTAIASYKLGRHFVTVDVDPAYVQITEAKLRTLRMHRDMFGYVALPKKSVKKQIKSASKREVEVYLQNFAMRLGRVPTESEIEEDNPAMLQKIDLIYPTRGAAIKRCRIVLRDIAA
jgi:site-specific DNA-methyltransferase (adenine-specific)